MLGASAATVTKSVPAGIYGTLTGTVSTLTRSTFLSVSTSVTQNPDGAILTIAADVSDGVNSVGSYTYQSARWATVLNEAIPIYDYDGTQTYLVWTTHGVQSGSQSLRAYACSNYIEQD